MMITEVIGWAGLIFILLSIAGIYILHRLLSKRLTDKLSIWLFQHLFKPGHKFFIHLIWLNSLS
jgi:hypothetical protein